MNFKTIASAALFAVASSAAIVAQASSVSMDSSSAMHYRYGDRLDVKKVLSVEDDRSNACGVVNSRIDYLDSHGQRQSVEYRSYATSGCHES
ncbi:DUF2790 domain-containing protein [Pseudomonas shirazensis]|uniref:DUF2790 domain-containing protein n=1 Tax=Pseudomonas shirazensis TaxID=2745494 RepID=UPI003D2E8EAC